MLLQGQLPDEHGIHPELSAHEWEENGEDYGGSGRKRTY